ncbi:hypothetical protein Hanom_Chr08g00720831 [Helianthus anomalus]
MGLIDKEVLSRDKLVKASSERIKEKENEKLILENREISENFDKLKRTEKDLDERNGKTHKENTQLSGVLQAKEKLINQQLDEIVNLKLQYQEAKIENERINLKLNSYNSASFLLQNIVPKPIGKNKVGDDVYSDGTGVGYHNVPPPMCNNFSKKNLGWLTNLKQNVLKSESDSTKEDECFLNNYIPKHKSQDNLSDELTLVTYKMNGSDRLYSDTEFPIENVNVDKLKKVFKLFEIDVSEVKGLTSSKKFLNFERDKSYYKKPVVPPRFNN